MSLVKSKAIQLGFDATPANNFLIYQPLTPDGTFRIANGNQGATTDIMTVTSGGSVTFAGTTNFSSLNFGAGSESAPSLFPTGDSNTGIWFPAADTFAVSTGGTQRLRIASDGRITFGSVFLTTASSSAALDFSGVTSPSLNKSPSNSFAFTNNGGLNSSNPFWLGHHFASPTITVSGANNFPRASHFYSYTTATDPTDLTYNIWLGNTTVAQNFSLSAGGSSGYMAFSTSSTERMRIDSTGNTFLYGEGAASKGALNISATDPFIRFIDTNGTVDKKQWDIRAIGASGSEALEFRTINDANTVFSTKLWISNDGNVGIGNTTAAEKLEVTGKVRVFDGGYPYVDIGINTSNYFRLIHDNPNDRFYIGKNNAQSIILSASGATTIQAPTDDGTAILKINASSINSATFNWGSLTTASTIASGQHLIHHIGKAGTAYNAGYFGYRHSADGSTSNLVTIGMHSYDNILNINAAGKVGIGTVSPAAKLSLVGSMASPGSTDVRADGMLTMTGGGGDYLTIGQYSNSDFWIQSSYYTGSVGYGIVLNPKGGNVGIGPVPTAHMSGILHLYRVAASDLYLETGNTGTSGKLIFKTTDNGSLDKYIMMKDYWTELGAHDNEGVRMRNSSGTIKWYVTGAAGNMWCAGALSKGSGSFRIEHPHPTKSATHDLVHSFIEGPQADLIYRGKVTLTNGAAIVNIDIASGMTEGTFTLLCRDVQCFTSNESGWTAVRGHVAGNKLHIEAQDNACVDTISWMVVGERQDKHMYDTAWTDDDGKVIVEPLRITEEQMYENSLDYHANGA